MTKLKIVAISDTHSKHKELTIPECDVLIHAGDFTKTGKHFEVRDFLMWFNTQPAAHKILIAGNHEETLDATHSKYNISTHSMVKSWGDIIYLENREVIIDGIKFYGTPWTPFFYDWGFNGVEGQDAIFEGSRKPRLDVIYGNIPNDTHVIICHGPMAMMLDKSTSDDRCGSVAMYNQIKSGRFTNLRLFLCGHIHEARGQDTWNGVQYCNVSTLDRNYSTVRPPVIIELDNDGAVISVGGYE